MNIPDFDEWKLLFANDPEEFERKRMKVLREVAFRHADTPEKIILAERTLAKIHNRNMRLNLKYKDPAARLNASIEFFWKDVAEFLGAIRQCGLLK